ncbi:MAG TPA: hypothetical protein VFH60_10415, partial [Chloroflexia bacterium]|nr:hypothetical protein [Chloroflexia bacterium]
FYLPWLQLHGLVPPNGLGVEGLRENLAAKHRTDDSLQAFGKALSQCFKEVARVLKPDGRLVFTYQHKTPGAWQSLGEALHGAGFRVIQLFPMLGDSSVGLHTHEGSIRWDAVFVARKTETENSSDSPQGPLTLDPAAQYVAQEHYRKWVTRLERTCGDDFHSGDSVNFHRACAVAAALGLNKVCSTTPTADEGYTSGIGVGESRKEKPLREALQEVPITAAV